MQFFAFKSAVFLFFLSISASCFAKEITQYNEFFNQIQKGKNFHFITHFNKCKGDSFPSPNVISYGTPTSIVMLPDQNRISTSILHFSNHSGKPAYEYVRYTFNADNKATIQIFTLDPQTFQPILATKTFECVMGDGIFVTEPRP